MDLLCKSGDIGKSFEMGRAVFRFYAELNRFPPRRQVADVHSGKPARILGEVFKEIPPRTAAWLDTYTRCRDRGLYWPGTHCPTGDRVQSPCGPSEGIGPPRQALGLRGR